jgi:hypothetical protein
MDITSDPLPEATLCPIRQVLQHLSNEEIGRILGRVRAYRYVIVTEHYPGPSVRLTPNRDKPHGHDTRILDDAAVVLDAPPFDCRTRLLLDADAAGQLKTAGERIRSFLIEGFPRSERA